MEEIKVGNVYRHYKGALYKVFAIAIDTESQHVSDPNAIPDTCKRVIYYAINQEHIIWDRPYTMFSESVNIDGKEQPRFKLYSESMQIS